MLCQKMETKLGDCHYCVSRCLKLRKNYEKSYLLMSLSMINTIEEFDEDNNEQVDMRASFHFASVNYEIIDTKKNKI